MSRGKQGPNDTRGSLPFHRRHEFEYSAEDFKVLRAWYFERTASYPNLKKFEGGANWPEFKTGLLKGKYSDQDGATWRMRTPHSELKFGGRI